MQTLASAKYGMPTLSATGTLPVAAGATNGAVTTGPHTRRLLDPENPELWLLGIGAVMLGLVAVSTSVRVGPLRFAAAAGNS